jgi:hypothetical protein
VDAVKALGAVFPPKITTRLILLASEDDLPLPTTTALGGEETRKKAGETQFSARQKWHHHDSWQS